MKKYKCIEVSCGDEIYYGFIKNEVAYHNADIAFSVLSLPFRKKPTKFQVFKRQFLKKAVSVVWVVIVFYGVTACFAIFQSSESSAHNNWKYPKFQVRPTGPSVGETLFTQQSSETKNSINEPQ